MGRLVKDNCCFSTGIKRRQDIFMKDGRRLEEGVHHAKLFFDGFDQFSSDKTLKDLVIFQLSYFMIENFFVHGQKNNHDRNEEKS